MRVLILHHSGTGGSVTSAHNLYKAMAGLDVEVQLELQSYRTDAKFDWIVLYGGSSPDESLPAAYWAKDHCRRLAIVSIWYDRARRLEYFNKNDIAPGYTTAVAAALAQADVLFVATMAEAYDCWQLVGRKPIHLFSRGAPDLEGVTIQDSEDYVCCLARIEPAKNQLTLAAACHSAGLPLVCVGNAPSNNYTAAVIRSGAKTTGHLPHEEALDVLSRARVHALISFGEQGGNSHIEAGLMGVPGVLGKNPQEVEFFGTGGIYADPTNVGDVIAALREAWDRPRRPWVDVPSWDTIAAAALDYMEDTL